MSEVYDWDNTAANNNDAPPDGFPENMDYSDVNDAAREVMAAVARWEGAVGGALTTAGASTAYTLTIPQTLSAYAAGQHFAFIAHVASGAAPTLDLNGLGARALVNSSGGALGVDNLAANSVYRAVVRASDIQVINSAGEQLPVQTSQAAKILTTDGSSAAWTNLGGSTARTANYTYVQADGFETTYVTGASSPTFDLPASVDAGWAVRVVNAGTGVVAVTSSNASDTLDGVTNGTWYILPGETAEFVKTPTSTAWIIGQKTQRKFGSVVYRDTNQTITTATQTDVNFDNELFDDLAFHDNVTLNQRLTIPANHGIRKVRLTGLVTWNASISAQHFLRVEHNGAWGYLNEAQSARPIAGIDDKLSYSGSGAQSAMKVQPTDIFVQDNDYFVLVALQSTGGNFDIDGDASMSQTWFGIEVVQRDVV